MKFLAILIAIFYYKNWVGENPLRKIFPFKGYQEWMSGRGLPPWFRYVLCVAVPALILSILMTQFQGLFLGLVGLLISLCVLAYVIEPHDAEALFDEQIIWLRSVDESHNLADVAQNQEDFEVFHIYEMFQSVVPALFWFVLLGPGASLFYALTIWYLDILDSDDDEIDFLETLVYWMELPAALITGLIFCLVGNFGPGIDYWILSVADFKESTATRLLRMAGISIDTTDVEYSDDVVGFAKLSEARTAEISLLCERSLYGWLGVAAIATIVGL
ncbi:MAG: membrane protein required for beta-lactamase induction [Flavobacterium sp.]|jgi:membrane protein required for beta-lactamase induction